MERTKRKPVSVGQGVTVHPDIMGGQPCVEGQRMPVMQIRGAARYGFSVGRIIHENPTLTPANVADALAWCLKQKRQRKQLVKDALAEFSEDMF